MFKNVTPHQIAIISALSISLIIFLLFNLCILFHLIESRWYHALIFGIVTFLVVYYVILSLLKKFIYRKIKLIYKIIHDFKRTTKLGSEVIDIDSDIFDEVGKEVSEWADSQQKEIESLKSLEAYRRNFLGNISHELKTPIFSIQGYIHTLLDGGLYDKEINFRYLERAAKNVERLHTIVEDLEVISRLESGEMVLDIRKFDIKALTSEVFDDLEIQAKKRKIDLIFKEGAGSTFFVYADRENIRQVLTNLVSNSIKYGKEGGQTKVSFYNMEKYILIEVADNGIGISEEDKKHVFDRFYRVDKSRSREQGGSGLGLAIVKHIIEAHRQTINVRSTIGRGATFGFTLEKA